MNEKFDWINKSALEFNREKLKEIEKICFPLKKFGIAMFVYIRLFNGGKRFYLSNRLDWVNLYINNHFQDIEEHLQTYIPQGNIRYSLASGFKSDKVYEHASSLFNFGHEFTIHEKHEDYADYFNFVAHNKYNQIEDFYLNNINLLELFVREFKEKAIHIIDYKDKSKLLVPKKEILFSDIQYTAFVEEEKIKNFMKEIRFKPHLNS